MPLLVEWPDTPPAAEARWRRYYPLFPRSSAGQLFNIAVYLHKMHQLMLLENAASRAIGETAAGHPQA